MVLSECVQPPPASDVPMVLPACVPRDPFVAHIKMLAPIQKTCSGSVAEAIGRFSYDGPFQHVQTMVLCELDRFFTDDLLRRVRDCVQQRRKGTTDTVSLRTLDWLVTNYSKKFLVPCVGVDKCPRDLHNVYRETLSFYSRALFDPFCRGSRVRYTLDASQYETTIGQLNFFRFMLHSGMLEYALANAQRIEDDMTETQQHARIARVAEGKRKRRHELTKYVATRVHVLQLRPQARRGC